MSDEIKLGLDPQTWSYRFKFEGHRYTLIKRNKSKDGVYWIRMIQAGQPVVRSLDTNIAAAAEQKAIVLYIKPAKAGAWNLIEVAKPKAEFARMSAVVACYKDISIGRTSPLTVAHNINAMRLVIRRGLGNEAMTPEEVDLLPSTVLTGKLVGDFEDFMARMAVREKRDMESNKRSVLGYLRMARSFFKATARERYGEKDVTLPDLTGFMKRAVERPARLERQEPDDKLLAVTFAAANELRATNRAAYIAFLLGLCSMRAGEVSRMTWDWIVEHNGRKVILIPAEQTKAGVARKVPLDARVIAELEAYQKIRQVGKQPEKEKYVLHSKRPCKDTTRFRAAQVFKVVNKFMRACGWKTNHTLHEMRALTLGRVRDEFGLDTAQALAGHQDQRTTKIYTGQKAIGNVVIKLPMQIGEAV